MQSQMYIELTNTLSSTASIITNSFFDYSQSLLSYLPTIVTSPSQQSARFLGFCLFLKRKKNGRSNSFSFCRGNHKDSGICGRKEDWTLVGSQR
uniref:Uncharacterized protein n=1 Tax=Rhizophora mucronata TaxID=61149 RepID=A0A2P2JEA2_RHIMU